MNHSFRTIAHDASIELNFKKSRFIAYAKPVSSENQALAFLHEIRKQHHAANHNCFAYVIDEMAHKQSDDGEPSGTAGKPILESIRNLQLSQTLVVVTRYFGGTMLGTGGLIRAYGEAAVASLQAAQPVQYRLHISLIVTFDYHYQGKIEYEIRSRCWLVDDTIYGEQIEMHLFPLAEEQQFVSECLTEWTNGKAQMVFGEKMYRKT